MASDDVSPANSKGNLVQAADVSRNLKNYHEELIDCRVKVWWPLDETFYRGKITSFNRLERKHQVDYDDGDKELLDLSEEIWELVGDEELPGGDQATLPKTSPKTAVFEKSGTSSSRPSRKKRVIATAKPTSNDKKERVSKRKLRSDEGQEIHQEKAAASASKKNTSRSSSYPKRSRSSSSSSSQDANSQVGPSVAANHHHMVTSSSSSLLQDANSQVGPSVAANHHHMVTFVAKCIFLPSKAPNLYYPPHFCHLLWRLYDLVKKLQTDKLYIAVDELDSSKRALEYYGEQMVNVSWLGPCIEKLEKVRSLVITASVKDFDVKIKMMMEAKKRFKKVQKGLNDMLGSVN